MEYEVKVKNESKQIIFIECPGNIDSFLDIVKQEFGETDLKEIIMSVTYHARSGTSGGSSWALCLYCDNPRESGISYSRENDSRDRDVSRPGRFFSRGAD